MDGVRSGAGVAEGDGGETMRVGMLHPVPNEIPMSIHTMTITDRRVISRSFPIQFSQQTVIPQVRD